MDIDRRIAAMRERLEHSTPARMTVTLPSGETITTDPVGVITLFQERGAGEIAGVTTDRDDYRGMAGMLDALCRPAPNRRIADYE